MWEFVPCIEHPAAESFEAIDVRFGSLADHPGALSIGPTMTGVFPEAEVKACQSLSTS